MSAETHDHREWLERAALFAIDALGGDERSTFEAHVATCVECRREVAGMRRVGVALAHAVPQIDPPAALRARVLTTALGPGGATERTPPVETHERPNRGWLAVAAALVLAAGLGAYAVSLRNRVGSLEAALDNAQREVAMSAASAEAARRVSAAAQQRLDVMTAADSARVRLAGSAPAPAAGHADWSRTRGLVVSLENLRPASPGRTYQVWYLTTGMPVSAGLLQTDAAGRVTALYPVAAGALDPIGFALTDEPDGGSAQPTTQPFLVGLLARGPAAPR